MKPPRVGSGLSQSAGAVDGIIEEVGQFGLQLVPRQTFIQGPLGRVLTELLLQMPGQGVILRPHGVHVPESKAANADYRLKTGVFPPMILDKCIIGLAATHHMPSPWLLELTRIAPSSQLENSSEAGVGTKLKRPLLE